MNRLLTLTLTVLLAGILGQTGIASAYIIAPGTIQGDTIPERVIYKRIDTVALYMDVYTPGNRSEDEKRPAIVFFFGGGWNTGNPDQFRPHARYFSSRGLVCFLVDYRVRKRQGTTPFEALSDAKSAMRYVKAHAEQFNVDSSRIVAAGGSAGGQLAAATALVTGFNDERDDLSISTKPTALVLFNPVVDNGPEGYGYERIGDRYQEFSPLHNVREGVPPTIFFLGTRDKIIPVETAMRFKAAMEAAGGRCELILYQNQPHGFFNFKHRGYYQNTIYETDRFLRSLGILNGSPSTDRGIPGDLQTPSDF